jgi:hypothetical protein
MSLLVPFLQLLPALILIAYGYWKMKKYIKTHIIILAMLLPAVILYPALIGFGPLMGPGLGSWGYFIIKLLLFVAPGFILIKHLHLDWKDFGITRKRLKYSIGIGLLVLAATALFNSLLRDSTAAIDLPFFLTFSIPLFLDAFNEEFLFRGAFFLFAWKKGTNVWIAFIASTILTIAWHPLELARLAPSVLQGSLLCLLLYKSGNITGAWVSHGLNRSVVQALGRFI